MIPLTRGRKLCELSKDKMYVNPKQVTTVLDVEAGLGPSTEITMSSGNCFLVWETVDQVLQHMDFMDQMDRLA